MASTSAYAGGQDEVQLHCSGDNDSNGLVALDCTPATPEKPANQSCQSLKSTDDPGVSSLIALLGLVPAPGSSVGVTCRPL
ncbi:hypothetical protein [Streptomyces sp. NPDC006267]|uniref:hypothetical protein n=1 Tax=Streptomyces sp. NPDC006267 TaxID=3157173 RepID=UPI0033AA4424